MKLQKPSKLYRQKSENLSKERKRFGDLRFGQSTKQKPDIIVIEKYMNS